MHIRYARASYVRGSTAASSPSIVRSSSTTTTSWLAVPRFCADQFVGLLSSFVSVYGVIEAVSFCARTPCRVSPNAPIGRALTLRLRQALKDANLGDDGDDSPVAG
jgi:hypothetical protein